MSAAEELDFGSLTQQIRADAGIPVEVYKDKCLRRRIAVRMRACGVHTYADYQTLLASNPQEYERLRDAITINVTRFYRNAETWHAMRQRVLPDLWRSRGPRIRVWSAGCSSGEEPYTLAMLLAELAEATGPQWPAALAGAVDATDIDRGSMDRAEAATYRADALVELPPELAARYLEPAGDGWRVTSRVRSIVAVGQHDLAVDHAPQPRYDLIVCRNVVIYFDRPTQERLFSLFARTVAPGGYVVLGKVETLFGPARDRLSLVDPRERIYRKEP